jgi:hypothetical protein
MDQYKMMMGMRSAVWLLLVIAATITAAISFALPPLSFGWLAWCALGYLGIVVIWPLLIDVEPVSRSEGEAAQDSSTTLILFAAAVGIAIAGLGIFGFVEMQVFFYGLAALFIFNRLLKQTVGLK